MSQGVHPRPITNTPLEPRGKVWGKSPSHILELTIGILASLAAGAFVFAHWTLAVAGGLTIFALSFAENEHFILIVIFLLPVSWVLNSLILMMSNVSVAVRVLVVAGFFLGRLMRGQFSGRLLFRSSIARASLGFLCVAIASNALGKMDSSRESWHSVYDLASYIAFFLMLVVWLDSRQRLRKALWALLISTIVTSVFALYQQIIGGYTPLWLYLNPQDQYSLPWEGRSTSFTVHPNCLAGYVNLILPFALACYVRGQGKWKNLGGFTVGLGFLALLSTQSVGGLLGFVAILVLTILCFTKSRKKQVAFLCGLCASGGLFYALRSVLNPVHTEQLVASDVITRLLVWKTAWNYFMQCPVMGVGWGNSSGLYGFDLTAFMQPGKAMAAHNIYLQLLAETGLLGFLAFSYLVVQSWRQGWSQFRSSVDFLERAVAFGVLGALLSVLAHGFVDFLFQGSQQFAALFWVILALLVASARLRCTRIADRFGVPGIKSRETLPHPSEGYSKVHSAAEGWGKGTVLSAA